MVVKTKWVTIDVDKLDDIFNVMDKINTSAVRGLIDHEGKDLLLNQLRQEIPHTIISQESDKAIPAKTEEPKEEPQEEAKSETKKKK